MNFPREVGRVIKRFRESVMTQATLALKAQVKQTYLAEVEEEKIVISPRALIKICVALGVHLDEVLLEATIPDKEPSAAQRAQFREACALLIRLHQQIDDIEE